MSLIVLTSANGSPGVTTTALGLALGWTRPVVLVDADPTGARAIAAGYFRGAQLPTDATTIDLAVSFRQGTVEEDLPHYLIDIPGSRAQLLSGPLRHTQARALDGIWDHLGAVFKNLERNGQDVIVDAGRLGLEGSPRALLTTADLTLLVTRTTLPSLVAASSWSPTLMDAFAASGAQASLGSLVVGPGMPYSASAVTKALDLPVVASLAWDPTSAEVFTLGATPGRKFETASLPKSLRAAVQAIQGRVASARQILLTTPALTTRSS